MINSLIPSVLNNTSGKEHYLDLISKLLSDRIILISGPIDSATATTVVGQLLFLESVDANADISIYVNSPGGSVSDGLAIIDTMNHIRPNVCTICCGVAASMGAMILSAGEKGKRYILPNAETMIHQPLGQTQGQASDMILAAQHIERTKLKLNEILAQNCGRNVEEIAALTDRDTWLTAQESMELGIVDSVL